MSGQLALVFHVLVNAAAVPSTSPLITLKSSLILLLKFPHKPVGWGDTHLHICYSWIMIKLHIKMCRRHFPNTDTIIRKHTRGGPCEGRVSWDEDLHQRRQLDHHCYANIGAYEDVEGWWTEDTQVRCIGRRHWKTQSWKYAHYCQTVSTLVVVFSSLCGSYSFMCI